LAIAVPVGQRCALQSGGIDEASRGTAYADDTHVESIPLTVPVEPHKQQFGHSPSDSAESRDRNIQSSHGCHYCVSSESILCSAGRQTGNRGDRGCRTRAVL
jgi:hypothetical protein